MATSSKFTWNPYPEATGYNVYRAPEADPTAFVLTETNIPVSILDIDCEYVRVTAITPGGESPVTCDPLHFCYVPPLDPVTYMLTNYQVETMDLIWESYPEATGYNVYIADESDPENFVIAHSNIAQTAIPIDCQYAIVTAITPQGETPQGDPVHYCYVPPPLEGLPISYYKLDDAVPVPALIDSMAGYNLDQTFAGTGTSTSGKIGTAVRLNDTFNVEWGVFPTDGHFDMGDFTIRFWIIRDHLSRNGNRTILFSGSRWTITINPEYWDSGLAYIGYTVDTDPSSIADVPDDPLIESTWNHVVLWYQAGVGCGLRINNGTDHLVASANPLQAYTNLNLRLRGWTRTVGVSAIDEIAIWNRVLTGAEITADWNGGAGVTYP